MDASLHSRLPKRSMNTRLALLICQERCWRLCPSFLCSNPRHSSFSRRKRIKKGSLMRPCRDSTRVCLPPRQPNQSGRRSRESVLEKSRIATREFSVRFSNSSFPPLVSRQQHCPDLIHTCLQISRSLVLMVYSLHLCQASPAPLCATL